MLFVQVAYDPCGIRGAFRAEGKWVGLEEDCAVRGFYLVLVELRLADIRDEELPDSRVSNTLHRMTAPVPTVEGADDANPLGIGGPDCEIDS